MTRFAPVALAACNGPGTMLLPDGGTAIILSAGDPCGSMPQLVQEAYAKMGDCSGEIVRPDAKVPALTEANCRARLPKCSTDDKAVLDTLLTCLRSQPVCKKADSVSTWQRNAEGCLALINNGKVSMTCLETLSAP